MPATRFLAPGRTRPASAGLESVRSGPVRLERLRPRRLWLPTTCLLVAACLLLALTGTARAATSETCLRRCLGVCADKGQAGSEACLRPCLQDCPVHCGTVDADCALACVAKANDAGGETAGAPASTPSGDLAGGRAGLAARCAGACTVMADCRPSAYDNGPADLFPATPAPHVRQRPQ